MPTKTYQNFSEVEQEVIDTAPPIVYKYRTWIDEKHKDVLKKNSLWFSHPFELNDCKDVRPDFAYDVNEVTSPRFYQHLLNAIPSEHDDLSQYEKNKIVDSQWGKIKADPEVHFNGNRQQMLTREHYDQYGVFSTSTDCLNLKTWEVYGDNHKGYCIGFKTLELERDLKCLTGIVTYSDKPFPYSFFKDKIEQGAAILRYKKTKWNHEKEFRFVTVGIDIYTTRLRSFKPETAAKVVLGYNIDNDHEKEILKEIDAQYPDLPVYKTKLVNQGQLCKDRIR